MTARTYTDGSVSQRDGYWRGVLRYKDGGTWRTLSKKLTDPDGNPIPAKAGTKQNIKAAEAALKAWRADVIAADERAMMSASAMTVPEFVEGYIDRKAKMYNPGSRGGGGIEPSTAHTYRKLNERIAAAFGGVMLADLTRASVRQWMADEQDDGTSGDMVRRTFTLLKSACKEAVADDLIPFNPCDSVTPPSKAQREKNTLDEATVAALNAHLDARGNSRMTDAARIALHTGMRVGEICALKWSDIDFAAGLITVRRAIGTDAGKTYAKTTKSGKARTVPLDRHLRRVLEERRARVLADCESLGVSQTMLQGMYVLGDVVPSDEVEGSHATPNSITKQWAKFAEAVGLKGITGERPTFHDLRHTYASIAIRYQNDAESVASILGHSSTRMTLDVYATALPDAVRATAERMGEIMGRCEEPNKVIQLPLTGTDGRN